MKAKGRMSLLAIVVSVIVVFQGVGFAKKFDDKSFEFFEWTNPAPRFSDFGLNIDEVRTIIGDSQMLISHKGRDIELWTSGYNDVKKYENARFVSSLTIFNLPREAVVNAYLDFKNYPECIPQYKEGDIVKEDGDQFLVKLEQSYHFIVVTLQAEFRFQYKIEEDGDYSALMLDGDVGAGVKRLEFISLDDDTTLVVNTSWMDLDSARFMYRTIIKAQPDFKYTAPMGAVAMETDQIKAYIEKSYCKKPKDVSSLPTYPDTPIFAKGSIPRDTLRRLSDMGTLVFVYPDQWIKRGKNVDSVKFISSITQLPGTMETTKPFSSDFTRFNEYFKQARKVEYREDPTGTEIDWNFKFGLGVIGVGMNYTTKSHWQNKNTVLFDGVSGDIDPLYGAWEWMDTDTGNTMVVFTTANRIGDKASWALKLANKIPNIEVMSGIFMGVLVVEKQAGWVGDQIKSNKNIASK